MKRLFHCVLAMLLCGVMPLLMWADSGELYTSGKLSSSLINCLVQDRYGYIWIGTDYGLSKFDGYRFTNYLHDHADTTSIADNIISEFLVDRQGNLWIGSAKGLMRYNYERNDFTRVRFSDHRTPRIYSLQESHRGDILVGSAGYGLYVLRPNSRVVERQRGYSDRDSDVFFTHIFEDSHHYLWQSSHLARFCRFEQKGGRVVQRHYDSPCGAPVSFLQQSPQQMLIVCMNGILSYHYQTQQLSEANYDFGPFRGNITINRATFDHAGNLYICTSEHGVLVARKGSGTIRQLESSNASFNLATAYVNDLIEDKDHNLWAACYKKGLYLINQQQQAFVTWSFSAQNYVIGSSVSSMAAGNHGETWCTVQNSGVFCFDRQGRIIAHPQSPAGTSIIYQDRHGHYWISNGNALYAYDPYTGHYDQRLSFTSAGVYCMADDRQGNLYVSVYSKGIYVYNEATRQVKVLNMQQRSHKGNLCNDWVRGMMTDRQGLLWIGTSNGVSCMDTHTMTFGALGWHNILKDKQSNCMCEDQQGNVIIGTDEGLYLYDRKHATVGRFPHSEVLSNRQILSITRDHSGDLWLSTTMGIWQYSRQKQRFVGHVNGNGLRAKEYMLGAMIHNADDFIAFGTADGITTFYPATVKASGMPLDSAHLTNLIIDGKSMPCMGSEFVLDHMQNSFTLEFSLLNYKNTDNISYEYRINNGRWNTTNEGQNAIAFNKLVPGRYQLEVRAINNGRHSDHVTSIVIVIRHPWYATFWAYLIYIGLAAMLIAYVFYAYERRRQADLDETKMQFLINATHDIRSPLTLIMAPLNKLKQRIKDAESMEEIKTIDRNAQRLLLLVNQILDERKIDKHQMRLHCQPTNLVGFVRGIMSLFAFQAKEHNITLNVTLDDDVDELENLRVWIDRVNFDKVITNLLTNAMKYSFDGGQITIHLSCNEKNAIIKVADTGIGLTEEKTDMLFERFYQGKNSRSLHVEGTGIGLNLCRAIVQMHHGTIRAYNRTDGTRGACIEVTIPLGKSHLAPDEIMQSDVAAATDVVGKKKQGSKNYRILLVDDDAEIARYIKGELSDWYRFDYAPNGKEGLKMLLTGKYDLVVSDVMMPEMDGIAMLRQIKANANISDMPVILLTSKSEVENRLEGLRRGADAFLAKPFDMDELHVLIDNLVDNVRRIRGKYAGTQHQAEPIEVKGNNDALMERIMKCVNENLSDSDFRIERLAEMVGISRTQLHRKMREVNGISASDFVRNVRLQQAVRLIEEGKINITQVAYAVGFNSQTHFSSVFKKHFGVSPTEYAESHRNRDENEK